MSTKKNQKKDYWENSAYSHFPFSSVAEQGIPVPPTKENEEREFGDFANSIKTRSLNSYFDSDDLDDNDCDDSVLMELQPHKPKNIKDYFDENDNVKTLDEMSNKNKGYLKKSLNVLSNFDIDKLREEVPCKRQEASQIKKDNAKRLTLQDMQSAIVSKISLITHNGGLYYYNGRTYKAISTSYELLGLIRSRISPTAFSSATTKPFVDLLIYLKADPNLVPSNYEVRLNQSKHLVVLRNGVLDLRTLKLLHHSPKYLTFHEFDAEFVDRKPKNVKEWLYGTIYIKKTIRLEEFTISQTIDS